MFGAGIVTKLSIKRTLVLAAFCMSMVSFAQVIPAWRADLDPNENPDDHGGFW
tara:strand:+ start:268 stop:426 length:159 start_codon:yes stop_codon:yes gene_type:complete